jgi:predicted dehydrogenase
MYLRAKNKALGVGNYESAVGSGLIRGDLIRKALRQGLSPRHGLEASHFNYKPPEKPLVIGLLGAGQQGLRLLRAATPKYIAVKSIADLRPSRRKIAAEAVNGAHVYDSCDKLLAAAKDDGLEAVIIALPSHLHAQAALAALEAGLHVFVETPMALSVADAKKVALKACEKNLVLAVGQQRRYNWIYDHASEMVRKDLLDQMHYLRAQWHFSMPEKTANSTAVGGTKTLAIDWRPQIPKEELELNFDGYASPEELVRWRLYEAFSGGLLAELGSQLFDAAVMLVEASPHYDRERPYPLSVAGSASQVLRNPAGDIDDHVHCIFEYALQGYVDSPEVPPKARKKIALQFDMIVGSDFDGYGETVLGRKGSLVLENEQKAMLFFMADIDKTLRVVENKDVKGVPEINAKDGKVDEEAQSLGRLALEGADQGFAAELEHWAFCCKPPADGKKTATPRCGGEAGLYTTVLTVAAAKAVKNGARVDFKKEWFDMRSEETPDTL